MIFVERNLRSCDWIMLDGCKSGWIVSFVKENNLCVSHVSSLFNIDLKHITIFIDMPVHLPKSIAFYPRKNDTVAKKLLGKFHSSVFYAPLINWLSKDYAEINHQCEQVCKPKLSKQSFNLFKKINEVQSFINSTSLPLLEVHPELLIHFFLQSKKRSKKTTEGLKQRLNIINRQFGFNVNLDDIKKVKDGLYNQYSTIDCTLDDIVDSIFVTCLIESNNLFSKYNSFDTIKINDIQKRFRLFIDT